MRLLRNKYYLRRWPPEMLAKLPDHYQRFLDEARKPPTPVHYTPETGRNFEKDPVTGEIKRFQDCPIPLMYPKEYDSGLWGGEAIIQGYGQRKPVDPLFPKFYVPNLKRFVVYSEILDKYLSVIVTNRTLRLIDEVYGFDAYILRTPVADLGSQLAFDLRRMMLVALARKSLYPEDPVKRKKILEKYQDCIVPDEEAEWFGLPINTAMERALAEDEIKNAPQPLKHQYRQELIHKLTDWRETHPEEQSKPESWLTKLNPFAKKS